MLCKLVGYKRICSKSGKMFCIAQCVSEFTEREKHDGFVGSSVKEVFLPDSQYDFLNPSHIGKDLSLNYDITGNGRAVLNSVDIVKG